jgi:hypothetical protein
MARKNFTLARQFTIALAVLVLSVLAVGQNDVTVQTTGCGGCGNFAPGNLPEFGESLPWQQGVSPHNPAGFPLPGVAAPSGGGGGDSAGAAAPNGPFGGWASGGVSNSFRTEVQSWHRNDTGNQVAAGLDNVQTSLRRMSNDPVGAAIALAEGAAGSESRVVLRPYSNPLLDRPEFSAFANYRSSDIDIAATGQTIGGVDFRLEGAKAVYLEHFHIDVEFQDLHYGTEAYQLWESSLPESVKTIRLSPAELEGRFGPRDSRPFWLKMGFKDQPRGPFGRRMIKTLP